MHSPITGRTSYDFIMIVCGDFRFFFFMQVRDNEVKIITKLRIIIIKVWLGSNNERSDNIVITMNKQFHVHRY